MEQQSAPAAHVACPVHCASVVHARGDGEARGGALHWHLQLAAAAAAPTRKFAVVVVRLPVLQRAGVVALGRNLLDVEVGGVELA